MRASLWLCLCLPLFFATLLGGELVAGQDGLTKKAIVRIEQYEKLVPDMKAGDVKTANYYINQVNWARKRLDASGDSKNPIWIDADKRCKALLKAIQTKSQVEPPKPAVGYDHNKLVQLNKEVNNAYNNFQMVPRKLLQDEFRVKSTQKELAGFESRLAAFPANDDNVKIVTGNLANFRNAFDASMASLEKDKGAKAGAEAKLDALQIKYSPENRMAELLHPFTPERVQAWATDLRRRRDQELPADRAFVEGLRANAAMDQQKVGSMAAWLSGSSLRQLHGQEKAVRERIASDLHMVTDSAKYVLATDPKNRNHVTNRILGRGAYDKKMAELQAGLAFVANARAYDSAMGSPAVFGPTITDPSAPRPAQPDRNAEEAYLRQAMAFMETIAKSALQDVRMRKTAETDAELLKVAEEVLKDPSHKITGWLRLVQSTERTDKVKREAWVQSESSASASISYYEYKWEQFQVTTAEEMDGKVWLYANSLKRYSAGDPKTTIGRWLLTSRIELTPILPENVNK